MHDISGLHIEENDLILLSGSLNFAGILKPALQLIY